MFGLFKKEQREVSFGKKQIFSDLAYHHAIQVGETWYEVNGASKRDTGAQNVINTHLGPQSQQGVAVMKVLGQTDKTDAEISAFIDSWLKMNPVYDLHLCNCQHFSQEFVCFLLGPTSLSQLRDQDDHRRPFVAARQAADQVAGVMSRGGSFLQQGLPAQFMSAPVSPLTKMMAPVQNIFGGTTAHPPEPGQQIEVDTVSQSVQPT